MLADINCQQFEGIGPDCECNMQNAYESVQIANGSVQTKGLAYMNSVSSRLDFFCEEQHLTRGLIFCLLHPVRCHTQRPGAACVIWLQAM